MKLLIFTLFLIAINVLANGDDHHDGHHGAGHHSHPKYEFKYGVNDPKTGDIKQQWEKRDGDHVKGSYSLKESDGTTRVVDYHASDHKGFHADVKRIGVAHHPESHKHKHHDHHHDKHHDEHHHKHDDGHKHDHHDDHHHGHDDHHHKHVGHGHGHATSYASIKQHH